MQIQWIFDSYIKDNPIEDKKEGIQFAESMAAWQEKLSPEDFKNKLYKGHPPDFLKKLDTLHGRR